MSSLHPLDHASRFGARPAIRRRSSRRLTPLITGGKNCSVNSAVVSSIWLFFVDKPAPAKGQHPVFTQAGPRLTCAVCIFCLKSQSPGTRKPFAPATRAGRGHHVAGWDAEKAVTSAPSPDTCLELIVKPRPNLDRTGRSWGLSWFAGLSRRRIGAGGRGHFGRISFDRPARSERKSRDP